MPCLFYCFPAFSLSESLKVRLIKAFSPAEREIWLENVGLIQASVNPSSLTGVY